MKQILIFFFLLNFNLKNLSQTVADIITDNPNLELFETALQTTGLLDSLQGGGPFTVFAPLDNSNFNLTDEPDSLRDILLNHISHQSLPLNDLTDYPIQTLLGQNVTITSDESGYPGIYLLANDAIVTTVDIQATNGLVHIIDRVLLPTTDQKLTVWQIICNSHRHETLKGYILEEDLVDRFQVPGPITFFAPTNLAFSSIPDSVINSVGITNIVLYHLTNQLLSSQDLYLNREIVTQNDSSFYVIEADSNGIVIGNSNQSRITIPDLHGSNGIVHVIDRVLITNISTSISESSKPTYFFENPVGETITINNNNNLNCKILNISGGVVFNQDFNNTVNINTQFLTQGIYVLKLSGNGFSEATKFLKK